MGLESVRNVSEIEHRDACAGFRQQNQVPGNKGCLWWASLYFLITCLIVSFLVLSWNSGPIKIEDVDNTYIGDIRAGPWKGRSLAPDGIIRLKNHLEKTLQPARNPIQILFQHAWYNAITRGYDLRLWLEPKVYDSSKKQYCIYVDGSYVFLRIEYAGRNRVLYCPHGSRDLHQLVASGLVPLQAEVKPGE